MIYEKKKQFKKQYCKHQVLKNFKFKWHVDANIYMLDRRSDCSLWFFLFFRSDVYFKLFIFAIET